MDDLFELKFEMMYHLGVSSSDWEEMDLQEIKWLHGRLVQQRRDEQRKPKQQ